MKFKQYKLQKLNSDYMEVCWIDGDLKVGDKITLRDLPGKYKVIEKYEIELSQESLDLNRNPKWYSI